MDRGKKNSFWLFYRLGQGQLDWLAMDMREQVWSPLQNTAIWMRAWLYGHEPADDALAALSLLVGTILLASTPYDVSSTRPFLSALSLSRESTSAAVPVDGPTLRLILSGPDDPPALPVNSPATIATTPNGQGALFVRADTSGTGEEFH